MAYSGPPRTVPYSVRAAGTSDNYAIDPRSNSYSYGSQASLQDSRRATAAGQVSTQASSASSEMVPPASPTHASQPSLSMDFHQTPLAYPPQIYTEPYSQSCLPVHSSLSSLEGQHHQQTHAYPPFSARLPGVPPEHDGQSTYIASQPTRSVPVSSPLRPISRVEASTGHNLDVVQQPNRARMCGQGDKDRRPITPPPCVRLVILDQNGMEVDCKTVDRSRFILSVDLWSEDGTRNLSVGQLGGSMGGPSSATGSRYAYDGFMATGTETRDSFSSTTNEPITRNLIGSSLAASSFFLLDTENRPGIWFVLQDLSVRNEGQFRLRFSFVSLLPPLLGGSGDGSPGGGDLNMGRVAVLASCFSEVFTVYTAKKFPGVCESTALSRTFAAQGIKIPIRKESSAKTAAATTPTTSTVS